MRSGHPATVQRLQRREASHMRVRARSERAHIYARVAVASVAALQE